MTKGRYITISEEEAERLRQAAAAFSVAVNEAIKKITEAMGAIYASTGMTTDQIAEAIATMNAEYCTVSAESGGEGKKPHPCPDRAPWPRQEAVMPQYYARTSPARKQYRARSAIRKRGNRRRP